LMPIYEFYCPDNNKLYSFLARSLSYRDRVPRCPDGDSLKMEKRVSRFAITGKVKEEDEDDPFADIDESKMEAAMAELEKDMGGMDEENPDPRQMGRLMRKMCDLTGKEMPGPMEEMIGRMEAGEDPEALEEEYGDAMDDDGMDFFKKAGKRFKRGPVRDPKIYDMAEYV
ncbi:MAG: cytochrome C, partial [Verrucomicrobiota bacterium]